VRRGRAVVALALVAVLAGCSETKADAPEPTPDNIVDGTHTQVIRMPDGFRNVAFTCYGTTGLYVTSRGWIEGSMTDVASLPSALAVQPGDPKCSGGKP
jgi:hypothetical protein